jgi:4-hydroxy-2-oxoheptanedioate aldolase
MIASVSLRERLRRSKPFIATFSIIPNVELVELIALAQFDGVILDMEHGPYGIESLGPLIAAARARNIYAIARVRRNEASLIGAALDAGAAGVLVPQVSSKAEAIAAVSAARFAPDGTRGANPWVRAADFSGRAEWFAEANRDVAVIVMIEGKGGVAAAADILATPSLDGVFIGPVDLSHALGFPGQIDHPRVVETVEVVVKQARARSVTTAVFTPNAEGARRWLERGITMIAVGVDTAHILDGMKRVTAAVRARSQEVVGEKA